MINFQKSKEETVLLMNINGVPIQNLTELGSEYLKMQDLIVKYKQALEDIKDRLIVVTEEEPQSTINLVLDLKLIIEKILKEDK